MISNEWEKRYKLLNITIKKAKNPTQDKFLSTLMGRKDYPVQAKEITNFIDINEKEILEIGCGWGGLLTELLKIGKPKQYTVVDHPLMLEMIDKTLQINKIQIQDIKNTYNKNYDLLITNHCLSETPIEYRKQIYINIFPNCEKVFMIDSVAMRKEFDDNIDKLFNKITLTRLLKNYYVYYYEK